MHKYDANDFFMPVTPEALAAQEKTSIEAKEYLKAVGEAARSCINTEAFTNYKQSLSKAKDKILDVMVEYTNSFFAGNGGDMAVYGANMARYVTKYQDLSALLVAVERDAQKGKS